MIALVAFLASGCGSGTATSPAGDTSATPAAAATPTTPAGPTPASATAYADTLRIGGVDYGYQGQQMDQYRQASNGINPGVTPFAIVLGSLVYSALYRYDAYYNAIPDLADGPCAPQGDGTVIRCRLIETTFHDGTPLTADDVVYSYGVFQRTWSSPATIASLKEVRVVDPRTVDFVLTSVDPTFVTSVLPSTPILPRHAVEAAYADFVAATKGLKAADLVDARRHDRRGGRARSSGLHDAPRGGGVPAHDDRGAPLSRGLLAGDGQVRRLRIHGRSERVHRFGRNGPRDGRRPRVQ